MDEGDRLGVRWLVALLLLPGCAQLMAVPGASSWDWERSDSMLPDFSGQGDAFPVIVVHMHAEWSQRQKDEFERNPWVCADLAGHEIPIYRPSLGADSCDGPAADAATGRLFMDPAAFQAWDAPAIAVLGSSCYGGIVPLQGDEPGFTFDAVEHKFRVAWHGDRFTVDGHELVAGEVLKATYWVERGDRLDQRFVRVSFDFPGYWLEASVGPGRGYGPAAPERASFVNDTLLETQVPHRVATIGEALGPLVDAMGPGVRLADASLVVVDGKLTELVVGLRDEDRSVRWYMASREGEALRVLGNDTVEVGRGVPLSKAVAHFWDRPLDAFEVAGTAPAATRFVYAPTKGWDAAAGGVVQSMDVPAACQDCVFLRHDGILAAPDFRYAPDALPVEVDDAPTWDVTHHQRDGLQVRCFDQSSIKAS